MVHCSVHGPNDSLFEWFATTLVKRHYVDAAINIRNLNSLVKCVTVRYDFTFFACSLALSELEVNA